MSTTSWLSRAFVFAILGCRCMAVTIAPSNISQYTLSTSDSPIELLLPADSTMKEFSVLEPLYSTGATELNRWGLEDDLISVTSTTTNLTSHHIAYISCDPTNSSEGYLSSADILSDVFNSAVSAEVTAIVMYSLTSKYCNVTDLTSTYTYLYTMTSSTTSKQLLDMIDATTTPVHVEIAFANTTNTTSSSSTSSTSSTTDYSASPTTAVAMIILYSITGVITALFLGIIVTGAIRAHRHPERYGPRNLRGRARQSRARGLARAMLDTIPIVKFGDHEEASKSADVEMAGHGAAEEIAPADDAPVIVGDKGETQGTQVESLAAEAPPRLSTQSARSGIARAAVTSQAPLAEENNSNNEEAPGCSICTEDYQMGEDLRVLPCHHKFHPACIDPWLLNVSGTCPLCRIDLNPQPAEGQEGAVDDELAPPLEDDIGATPARRPRIGMRQSFLIGLGMGRVYDTTREERLEAIRAIREEQARMRAQREQRMQAAAEEAADERSRSQRLRERFGIRTSRRGQEGESTEDVAAAAASETAPAPADAETRVVRDLAHEDDV